MTRAADISPRRMCLILAADPVQLRPGRGLFGWGHEGHTIVALIAEHISRNFGDLIPLPEWFFIRCHELSRHPGQRGLCCFLQRKPQSQLGIGEGLPSLPLTLPLADPENLKGSQRPRQSLV